MLLRLNCLCACGQLLHLFLNPGGFVLSSCSFLFSATVFCVIGCWLSVHKGDNAFCLCVFRPWNRFIPTNTASPSLSICINGQLHLYWVVVFFQSRQLRGLKLCSSIVQSDAFIWSLKLSVNNSFWISWEQEGRIRTGVVMSKVWGTD